MGTQIEKRERDYIMMTKTEMNRVATLIAKATDTDQLNEIIGMVKTQQQINKASRVRAAKSVLTVGTRVKVNARQGVMFGSINEIRRTKATVTIDGVQYNCPLSLLEVA